MNPQFEAVMETVGPNGEFIDHFDGRMITPGHAIEAAWFIMKEAKHRGNDARLLEVGTTILDWRWALGWDEEYGGIIYFRDVKGLPVQEYWQDMKFWWPQNEAIIATLLAYQMTGDEKYARWHQMIHDWTYAHFPDPEYRRMVRLSAPGRTHLGTAQGQSVERAVPHAAHAVGLLADPGGDDKYWALIDWVTRSAEPGQNNIG